MAIVEDISRPDVGGVPPKMTAVAEKAREAVAGLAPILRVSTDDNMMSSVWLVGSFTEKPTNGIYENGLYFKLWIRTEKGRRYYEEGDRVTLELSHGSYKLKNPKLRKYTGTVEKVIARAASWIEINRKEKTDG